jgi:hypothetical protein
MIKSTRLFLLIFFTYILCQAQEFRVFDFQQNESLSYTSVYTNQIEFTLIPKENITLNDLVIRFQLPNNIKLYTNLLLNKSTTKTSYFQTTYGQIIDERNIQFSYPIITSEKGLLIYFHVVPFLSDTNNNRIIAELNWKNPDGANRSEKIESGIISSEAPPLEKLVVKKISSSEYLLQANLKYEYDYSRPIPDDAIFNLEFTSGSTKIKNENPKITIHPGQPTEYIVNGKISYEGTIWDVKNEKIVLNGLLVSDEKKLDEKTTDKKMTDEITIMPKDNYLNVGLSLYEGMANEFTTGLSALKIKLYEYLSIIPSKISVYHSFKLKTTSITFGPELEFKTPFTDDKLFIVFGVETGSVLFQNKEFFSLLNFGFTYKYDSHIYMQLLYKRHNNKIINSNLYFIISRAL